MGYLHTEIINAQLSKKPGNPCGDIIAFERTESHTTVIISDGIGTGIRANLAASMCVSRFLELLRNGFSLRDAYARVAETMIKSASPDMPYAVFTVARMLNDGETTILSYEMPEPVFVSRNHSYILPLTTHYDKDIPIKETHCHLELNEGIFLMSDGITLAGAGAGYPMGWQVEGVNDYINKMLSRREATHNTLAEEVLKKACDISKKASRDDCSACFISCREGFTLNILSGPPSDRTKDRDVLKQFMEAEGFKVVCGGTTAAITAKYLRQDLRINRAYEGMIAPPSYEIEGIDLVTEGAVTLNQVYNIIDENPETFEKNSPVTNLYHLFMIADRINFINGAAQNPSLGSIGYRQQRILHRSIIIDLLAEKLKKMGKLVVVERV